MRYYRWERWPQRRTEIYDVFIKQSRIPVQTPQPSPPSSRQGEWETCTQHGIIAERSAAQSKSRSASATDCWHGRSSGQLHILSVSSRLLNHVYNRSVSAALLLKVEFIESKSWSLIWILYGLYSQCTSRWRFIRNSQDFTSLRISLNNDYVLKYMFNIVLCMHCRKLQPVRGRIVVYNKWNEILEVILFIISHVGR